MAKLMVIIDTDSCKGCELCISVCPKQVLTVDKTNFNARGVYPVKTDKQEECIGCASCALMCPDGVLTIQKEV